MRLRCCDALEGTPLLTPFVGRHLLCLLIVSVLYTSTSLPMYCSPALPECCRASGGALDMRDVEATELALRQGVRLAQDAANGTKFDAQQQVSPPHWSSSNLLMMPPAGARRSVLAWPHDAQAACSCLKMCKEAPTAALPCNNSAMVWLQRLAEAALGTPAAAMGVLHHICSAISRRSYWRETYRVLAAPAYLGLLSIIVASHPLMHAEVHALLINPGVQCCPAARVAGIPHVACGGDYLAYRGDSLACGCDFHSCQMEATPFVTYTFCRAQRRCSAVPSCQCIIGTMCRLPRS